MGWGFVTCGPNEALVVSGCCYSKPLLVPGGRAFVWPVIQRVQRISLNTMTLQVESPTVYTSQGVPISVTGIAQVKIQGQNSEMLLAACEQFLSKHESEIQHIALVTLEGHQRAIMGSMTVEEIYKDRKKFSKQVFEVASSDLVNMGITVVSYTLKDIRDEEGYLKSLGMARTAEVKRDARIGEAEARCDAQIKEAIAEEQRMAARFLNDTEIAKAQRDFELKKAAYDVEVHTKKAEAEMAYELQAAKTKQRIKEEQMQIKVVERTQEIAVQLQEIQRREQELEATVRQPAEAEKFRLEKIAEAHKIRTVLEAEGQAEAIRTRGQAEAFAAIAKAKAEAEQAAKKAEAWSEYKDAAMLEMFLETLPKIAAEVAAPLSQARKVTMVSCGGGEVGAAKLTGEVLSIVQRMPEVVRNLTGVDISKAEHEGPAMPDMEPQPKRGAAPAGGSSPPDSEDSRGMQSAMYSGATSSPSSDVGTSTYNMGSIKTSDSDSRKRKSSFQMGSDYDDETGDDRSVRTNDDQKKQNHSEIEKRRRDKMNTYITELSKIVPMCHAMPRKLDKLTVLRMAVQHMKTIRGAVHSYTEGHYKPAFLTDQELKMLILQAADGFLFVVGCDRGRILYMSESVSSILNYSTNDLLGQSWFDILHHKDVAKVKEQLSSSDLSPRERLIDAKTMLPVKTDVPCGATRMCPGARRSFFCRMKCKSPIVQTKDEPDTQSGVHRRKKQDRKYSVIQCTGYLKLWTPAKMGIGEQEVDGDGDSGSLSCLVAVGRLQPPVCSVAPSTYINPPNLRTMQFISRHAMDGKFLFVDQRSTLVLGFLPQELLGTSIYEYYHPDDISTLAETHKLALLRTTIIKTPPYRLITKNGSFINLQSEWKSFRNPWTKDVEYLIAKNTVLPPDVNQYENTVGEQSTSNFDFFNQSNGREMQRFINTHVESSKIGSQIAEEVLESQRLGDSPSNSSPETVNGEMTMFRNSTLSSEGPSTSNVSSVEQNSSVDQGSHPINGLLPNFGQIYGNTNAAASTADSISVVEEEMMEIIGNSPLQDTPHPVTSSDGNDEAAMAVIMSLLEADAGLGGPVDFSGLPWPLP